MKKYELRNKGRAFFDKIAKSKVFDDLMFAVHKTNDFLDYGNGILKVTYYNEDIIFQYDEKYVTESLIKKLIIIAENE